MYTVKEIFYTLQGEGRQAGRASVFCRFAYCNLWNGLERDRDQAICQFCDTDFIGTGPDGGKFASATMLAERIASEWPQNAGGTPYVVFTGGEPLLQLDTPLIDALHERGFEIAVETNGTISALKQASTGFVSAPRRTAATNLRSGTEAGLSTSHATAGNGSALVVRALLPTADGWPAARRQHPGRHRLLSGPPALETIAAKP
ncbi:radical SAM protein [Paludibacterium denitrificans]|uniref:radical SAM protein n=1 Tax=Paludibacterium denitrificans TaxID=2675226 RepID=UPI001E604632|nr:radical SAM protein [Paludibacterium denitrificans]